MAQGIFPFDIGTFVFSALAVLAETPQPSAVPHATPSGLPDWPPPQQTWPGAVPSGPGPQPAGPSSAGRLGSETGQLPGAAQLVPDSPLLAQRFAPAHSAARLVSAQACFVRGINPDGLSGGQCRDWLSQWLQVSSSLKGNLFVTVLTVFDIPGCTCALTNISVFLPAASAFAFIMAVGN